MKNDEKIEDCFFHNLLDRFCKAHGFSLSLDFNTSLETWVCKIIFVASDKTVYDCAILNQEKFDIHVWSGYCKSVEEACEKYVSNMLGNCLVHNLGVVLDHTKREEALASGEIVAVPRSLEELIMKLDLEEGVEE